MALLVSIKLTMALAVPVLVFLLLTVGGNFSLLLLNGLIHPTLPRSLQYESFEPYLPTTTYF